MVTSKNGKLFIEYDNPGHIYENDGRFDVLYIANDSDFIIKSILFSIHTLVDTNPDIDRICILEDFADRHLFEKAIQLWKTEYANIFTVNIQDIVQKYGIEKTYGQTYKNRYGVEYDKIVNAKMLVPLFSEMFSRRCLLYLDSDMEVKSDLKPFLSAYDYNSMIVGIDEEDHKNDHENQDVDSKRLMAAGYKFDYLQKTGSWQYVNSGILLYNIELFNEMDSDTKADFVRSCFEIKFKCKFDFPEQDTMNIFWTKKCVPMYMYNVFSYKKAKLVNARIIHYIWAGDGKKELECKADRLIYEKLIGSDLPEYVQAQPIQKINRTEPNIPEVPATSGSKLKIFVQYHSDQSVNKEYIDAFNEISSRYPEIYAQIFGGYSFYEGENKLIHGMLHDISDDNGKTISRYGRQLNEFTNIYWAYKNYDLIGNPDYIGFCHYRRLMDIGKIDLDSLDNRTVLAFEHNYHSFSDWFNGWKWHVECGIEHEVGCTTIDENVIYPDNFKKMLHMFKDNPDEITISQRYFQIMPKSIFFGIMQFMDVIVKRMTEYIDATKQNGRQCGYLSEFVFSTYQYFYCLVNNYKIKYIPDSVRIIHSRDERPFG